ncbi:ABC transporter ATP-binding protein [Paenibacillus ginsengarvi]|uniref:sn-glycerol-3-phosphate ABC transporter ATP-binding protein UgpC n=1 Tax=Paenibacillus ginsengarvi TaxID=400777 RepID=A0A3B0CIT1_9BACL|nr:sn-glycerol-3-phosphate ABC transporter ATP-binding protein UgpC [Paenibacillus ginsengarvi]RKN84484.1 sn-glycerol-3-phosphate ABC transporter ATP-binding protein UgpC [Paenibacillus ginsengarvi]
MSRILFSHVGKRYGKNNAGAVQNFTLEIDDKEFIVIVGPSGCGKSTLIRMIAGLEEISEGHIYINNVRINDLPPKDRDIAMVFQNYALYPNMSVYENIAFGLRLRKMPKHEIDIAVKRAARLLEIEAYLERNPKQLSGGQRQRVALGRAIVQSPQLFLMDEPLSNLDAKLRVHMRSELIRLHKQLGVTTLYVTHDQTEAMTMASRIVVMKDGVIQQADTPEEIYNNPANAFVAGFIGLPPVNLIAGQVQERSGKLEFQAGLFAIAIPARIAKVFTDRNLHNSAALLGIRPEHVYLSDPAPPAFPYAAIHGTVQYSELLGADRYAYMDIGTQKPIVARTSPGRSLTPDRQEPIFLDMDKALFFHAETGERLV